MHLLILFFKTSYIDACDVRKYFLRLLQITNEKIKLQNSNKNENYKTAKNWPNTRAGIVNISF